MKDPREIDDLANRIDHEQLWRGSPLDRDKLTPEQRDRLDAGVYLRRYAHDRGVVVAELQKGREYIRGFKLERADNLSTDRRGCGTNEWHGALNGKGIHDQAPHWMYTAKMVSDEVPRMILLFEYERTGRLGNSYKASGHDPRPATPLPDNHLYCALGKQCRKCPFLARIDANERMTPEAKDEAKAWTCATHVLLESKPDDYMKTILRDKSDDAFEANLVRSLSDNGT
jgi:hypothetical protein